VMCHYAVINWRQRSPLMDAINGWKYLMDVINGRH
jgi:hypothetical protein